MDMLHQFFELVCGRAHTWSVGGQLLPFCERCTGLYIGGIYALVAIAVFRPRPTRSCLWLNGAFLLLMIPFGYHLVPQNAIIRTATGQLFGAGLAYFLVLSPAELLKSGNILTRSEWPYAGAVLAGIPVLLTFIEWGGVKSAAMFGAAGFAGLISYAILCLANMIAIPAIIWPILKQRLLQ